ncbi:carbohydrate esterase family 5 protein [Aulographum hederae CBS 113979]|uniref:Cutinase n=1 Tax=Aulographum hederae CBS 113979 TaxID=1176131 RepID=A0A6G1GLJ4_9PEZI|nr:carbohydrate esterase family 5 protein [Aulographum hederae CBS 113979]
MKTTTILAALAGVAVAAPANELVSRQIVANDLTNGACKDIFFIHARASTEVGNMGSSMGPQVCEGLKKNFPGRTGCQGVGGAYSAGLADNVRPKGTSNGAIAVATGLFNDAFTKCPQSTVVFGGYSQGTAVMLNAVQGLPEAQRNRLAGGVLFGYTKNAQTRGSIPGYPADRLKVFCTTSDGVCGGTLAVTIGHFAYLRNGDGPKAIEFLTQKINAAAGPAGAAAPAAGGMTGMTGGLAPVDGATSGPGVSSTGGMTGMTGMSGSGMGSGSGVTPVEGATSGPGIN